GTATYSSEAIARGMQLPTRVVPVMTLAVGYPAKAFPEPSDRIPVSGILHHEYYHDYTPADIDAIYGPKEALPESARFIAENNKQTLPQIFTDIRYPRTLNEQISTALTTFLKTQGF
ncbi:MAG: NADPH-dependent oxidoreductase, partial [Muribaculaceae bacterium]|nr:NADPH-dependent oxidoreductase [Muribaculaceae bacterium]